MNKKKFMIVIEIVVEAEDKFTHKDIADGVEIESECIYEFTPTICSNILEVNVLKDCA